MPERCEAIAQNTIPSKDIRVEMGIGENALASPTGPAPQGAEPLRVSGKAASPLREIELLWPPAKLSPNGSHGNYHAHAAAARKYRADCMTLLRSQNVRPLEAWWKPPIMLEMHFCPPTKRLSDLDNLLARAKQGIDALAETLGVDDQCFEYTLRRGEPVKGGRVTVSIG